eukprot:TRINITY_DN17396_c0_g1_i1.p1 TRINITY_DN17396_c0_g1~~TRINITY_DN17396_c0_g1_i1.p1  ORF type:complete len:207 (+),score=43.91 TRINITY_DN17396_c0_g1_i1:126-746(+)
MASSVAHLVQGVPWAGLAPSQAQAAESRLSRAAVCCRSQHVQPTRVNGASSLTSSFASPAPSLLPPTFIGSAAAFAVPSSSTFQGARKGAIAMGAGIQFIRGVNEAVVPDVKLTRSKDGSSGTALFVFEQPTVFESASELGEITGLYLVDDEGVLQSVDVSAKFVNGKPANIEAKYTMRSGKDWDRFMRFMERYATENNLGFKKSS